MDVLKAPAHLRGKIGRWSPQALKDERLEWVRKNTHHHTENIAAALGIGQTRVCRLRAQAGVKRNELSREGIFYRRIKAGYVMSAVLAMPPEAQDALEARAAKTGQTLAQVLAEAWVESLT